MQMILVSYVPLLRASGGIMDPEAARALDLDSLPSGLATACLWTTSGPVLAFDYGREIASHLVEWSEGDVAGRFDLCLREKDGRYAMALLPDMDKTIQRNRVHVALQTGFPVPADTKYQVVFRPLHFVSKGPSDYHRGLRAGTEFGILDTKDLDFGDPSRSDFSSVTWLGPVRVRRDGPLHEYVDGLFD